MRLVLNSVMNLPRATLLSASLLYLTKVIGSHRLKEIHHKQFAEAHRSHD